jgi:hypothetical protein
VRADFGGYAFDCSRGVKASASTFVGTTTVADVATFAFLFVVVEEISDFFACGFVESRENIPLHITGIWA